MTAYLILGQTIDLSKFVFEAGSTLIGIDRGAFLATQSGLKLDIACGDFDSVNAEEMSIIRQNSKNVAQLPAIKDITDTEYAMTLADNSEKIIILGGIQGKRIEHFWALVNILRKDKRVSIQDDNSQLERLDFSAEPYQIQKLGYKFISFFALEDSVITLHDVTYPLNHYHLSIVDSLCVSNQFKKQVATVIVEKGQIMMIRSRDDSLVAKQEK